MAKKENIPRFVTNLFVLNDGSDAVNSRRWNEGDNPLCTIPGCNNVARNQGIDNGGFRLECAKHLDMSGKDSYKNYKYVVSYCENKDGRLGYSCTTVIQHSVMLGVDHIDENRRNNDASNWQTLCACCDRFKTNIIGKKVKNGELSVSDMMEYFEINKRIKKKIASANDMIKINEIINIIEWEPKSINNGTFTRLISDQKQNTDNNKGN